VKGTSTAPTSGHRPTYPSSSRTKHNFDLIARTAEEEEAEEEKRHASDPNAGGDKALQQLFQKLYADADDDQKKAMLKSYQESNGTALSTDWGEVSKKPVEVKPPDVSFVAPSHFRGGRSPNFRSIARAWLRRSGIRKWFPSNTFAYHLIAPSVLKHHPLNEYPCRTFVA
jgi:hypothetical protein